jgi:hypothetical protein
MRLWAVTLLGAVLERCTCVSCAGGMHGRSVCLLSPWRLSICSDEEAPRKEKDRKRKHKRSKKKRRDRSAAGSDDDEAPRKKHRR